MKYKKKSESRKYDKTDATYIVENGTDFHVPLQIFSSSYDVRVTSPILPNGIAREIFTRKFKSDEKEFIYKLVNVYTVNKYISLQPVAPANP